VQEIGYAWSKQSVDTIANVGYALDELVETRFSELKAELLASASESTAETTLPVETA
jgi:hypothetical protein